MCVQPDSGELLRSPAQVDLGVKTGTMAGEVVLDHITLDIADTIRTAMLTFQQGAHVVEGSEKVMEDGTVQVTVEIDLRPLWDMVLYYQKTLSITVN